ncbi:hypothetical protein KI387_022979 [Taxus chinensis]|uniref:FYVE-type domain-containing protein n=1 Tax=Taxus chinensis TaxID=29808 RepID=A0AA38G1H0_TAXCH|nr:hypothetical protein KI387_022979 [Taxus chinensis]
MDVVVKTHLVIGALIQLPTNALEHNQLARTNASANQVNKYFARTPTKISALNTSMRMWFVEGCALTKTTLREYHNARGDGSVFGFDFVDQERGEIHITCFNEAAEAFYEHIENGKLYIISNGRIARIPDAKLCYNNLNNALEIFLQASSTITPLIANEDTIPSHHFHFTKIKDIPVSVDHSKVDLIGIVLAMSPFSMIRRHEKLETKRRTLQLKDMSGFSPASSIPMSLERARATLTGRSRATMPRDSSVQKMPSVANHLDGLKERGDQMGALEPIGSSCRDLRRKNVRRQHHRQKGGRLQAPHVEDNHHLYEYAVDAEKGCYLMEGGRLYPHVGLDMDVELEDKFYDFGSSVHSYREQGNSFFISEMVEGADASPPNQTHNESYADTKSDAETSTNLYFARKDDGNVQNHDLGKEKESDACRDGNLGRRFYYDLPLLEETGAWIPVSVPPMSESDHEEWYRNQGVVGGYLPEDDVGWKYANQELTLWAVVSEMLAVMSSKASLFAGAKYQSSISPFVNRMPKRILEQAWREMAQTLTDTSFNNIKDILEAEPAKWLADSAASACMLCNSQFHPIMRSRHHCRFCGLIYCGICSRGKRLLPVKFRTNDPQRVCDVCWVRLESVQGLLEKQVSHAAQEAIHDVTDLSTLRSWVNIPWGQSMENEIYKATNALRDFVKIGSLRPERSIPDAILRRAKGLALLTVAKVGIMVTYKVGTGLVIARKEDGSWSPPSAISSIGVGWGVQAGGEVTDFVIVLRTEEAVKTFSGNFHFSIGAGLNAAAGPIGRVLEADLRTGDGGSAACYTYSCSKGAFVGCSLEGNIVRSRSSTNAQFYGNSSIKASDILLGSIPRPTAAAPLYNALSELFEKLQIS